MCPIRRMHVSVAQARRRRVQFSMRAMFVLTFLIALALAWATTVIRRVSAQREAVAAILRLGHNNPPWLLLSYEDEIEPSGYYRFQGPRVRSWWGDLCHSVVEVSLWMCEEDEVLEHIGRLTTLEYLVLADCYFHNPDYRNLATLTRLKHLALIDAPFGDRDVCHLKAMKELEILSLRLTDVTDQGLKHLSEMDSLGELDLTGCKVSDQAVQNLQRALPNCRIVR